MVYSKLEPREYGSGRGQVTIALIDVVTTDICTSILDVTKSIPTFEHWAPDQPDSDTGENCAFFGVSENYHNSGFWEDADCSDDGYYAICEEYELDGGGSDTTTTDSPTDTTQEETTDTPPSFV